MRYLPSFNNCGSESSPCILHTSVEYWSRLLNLSVFLGGVLIALWAIRIFAAATYFESKTSQMGSKNNFVLCAFDCMEEEKALEPVFFVWRNGEGCALLMYRP